jgi:hypothetical protein
MQITDAAVVVSGVGAALSAIAASVSARASRQAVSRAHRPFVWAETHLRGRAEDGRWSVGVRLHNDGPGVAFEVSAAVGPEYVPHLMRMRGWRVWCRVRIGYASPPIRAMRAGEAVPPRDDNELFEMALKSIEHWWVVVRFTDAAGARWEFREPASIESLALPPQRVRRRPWRTRPGW